MYGRKREYKVLIQTEYLENYMREHGAKEQDIADMHRYVEMFEEISADKAWIIATTVYISMPLEEKTEFIRAYGTESRAETISHVADEILETCCRTVIDF